MALYRITYKDVSSPETRRERWAKTIASAKRVRDKINATQGMVVVCVNKFAGLRADWGSLVPEAMVQAADSIGGWIETEESKAKKSYVVQFRAIPDSAWTEMGTFSSVGDCSRAILRAWSRSTDYRVVHKVSETYREPDRLPAYFGCSEVDRKQCERDAIQA